MVDRTHRMRPVAQWLEARARRAAPRHSSRSAEGSPVSSFTESTVEDTAFDETILARRLCSVLPPRLFSVDLSMAGTGRFIGRAV